MSKKAKKTSKKKAATAGKSPGTARPRTNEISSRAKPKPRLVRNDDMKTQEVKKDKAMNFRPDADLRDLIDLWLAKNPGFENRSQVINMAVKKFVSEPQTLEPVTVATLDDKFEDMVKDIIKKEKRTLDQLK